MYLHLGACNISSIAEKRQPHILNVEVIKSLEVTSIIESYKVGPSYLPDCPIELMALK